MSMYVDMTCFHPLIATRLFSDALQKHVISFDNRDFGRGQTVYLPCGQCIGCRVARSREWAARCVHEASLWSKNCFITLTYDSKYLPKDGSLHVEHFQKFMKRLRACCQGVDCVKVVDPDTGLLKDTYPIRFLHCGEYGSQNLRPHYHAILFNFDFPDKQLWKISGNGDKVYRSPLLEKLWKFGFSSIGSVSFESCAYVARYVTKKVTGEAAEDHYQGRTPEYITMSRCPGIASDWFKKYHRDVFPQDFVVLKNGKKLPTPRYYMRQLEKYFPETFDLVQQRRLERQNDRPQWTDNSFLLDLEDLYKEFHEWERQSKVIDQRLKKKLKRRFENGSSKTPQEFKC